MEEYIHSNISLATSSTIQIPQQPNSSISIKSNQQKNDMTSINNENNYEQQNEENKNEEDSNTLEQKKLNKITKTRSKKVPIFLQKLTKQNKKSLLRKKDYIVCPIIYIPPDSVDVYADGDFILEMDFLKNQDSVKKPLNWSYFKSTIQINDINYLNVIEVHQSTNMRQRRDLQDIIQRYIDTPDKRIHDFGITLKEFFQQKEQYQNVANIQMIQNKGFTELLQTVKSRFVASCLEYVKKNMNQNGYYFYSIGAYCSNTHQYEQNHYGFSKPLINLLGFDSITFKSYTQRNGKFEFYNSIARMYNIYNKSKYGIEKWDEYCQDAVLLTKEGFRIYCKLRKIPLTLSDFQDIIKDFNLQHFVNEYWFNFCHCCGITEFQIDQNQITSLQAQRNDLIEYQLAQFDDEELRYQMQSEILLEKYYEEELKQAKINNQNDHQQLQDYNIQNQNSNIMQCNFQVI